MVSTGRDIDALRRLIARAEYAEIRELRLTEDVRAMLEVTGRVLPHASRLNREQAERLAVIATELGRSMAALALVRRERTALAISIARRGRRLRGGLSVEKRVS
ncbi:hypothetical protein [Streptomyces sp. NPDC002156]